MLYGVCNLGRWGGYERVAGLGGAPRGGGKYELGASGDPANLVGFDLGGCENAFGWGVKMGSCTEIPRAVEFSSSSSSSPSSASDDAPSEADEIAVGGRASWRKRGGSASVELVMT